MLEVVTQRWPGECGACCVLMIARSAGVSVTREQLDGFAHIGSLGLSAADLIAMLAALGIESLGVEMTRDVLHPAHLPCIVHWKPHHFVVLEALNTDTVEVIDPNVGRLSLSHAEFARGVGAIAIVHRTDEA
ncbi:MAG: hypothetical protein K2Y26_17990 [Gemmatimonadaceae bacterium]|nr:hypothetical protein [Gemmatimonadaceae bacterium]